MAAQKISISMDEDLLGEVQQVAEEAGMTVSAWLAETARHSVALDGWQKLIAEYESEHGAFSDEEMAQTRATFEATGFRRARSDADARRAS